MEISLRPAHPTPPVTPDVRPTADVAAVTRDPRPEVPLPIPPGAASSGIAASARIAEARPVEPVQETVRTLKPYGITMLPDEAAQRAAAERAREAAAEKAEAAAAPAEQVDPQDTAPPSPEAEARPAPSEAPASAPDPAQAADADRPETVGHDG